MFYARKRKAISHDLDYRATLNKSKQRHKWIQMYRNQEKSRFLNHIFSSFCSWIAMPGLSFTFVSFLILDSRFPRYVCPCTYVLLRCLFRRTSGRARAMDGFNFHRLPSGTRSYGVSVYRTSTRVSYCYISIDLGPVLRSLDSLSGG